MSFLWVIGVAANMLFAYGSCKYFIHSFVILDWDLRWTRPFNSSFRMFFFRNSFFSNSFALVVISVYHSRDLGLRVKRQRFISLLLINHFQNPIWQIRFERNGNERSKAKTVDYFHQFHVLTFTLVAGTHIWNSRMLTTPQVPIV